MTEFSPLHYFSLVWRFTDPSYNVLPNEVLAGMFPLVPDAAQEKWRHVQSVITNDGINSAIFSPIISFNCSRGNAETHGWLCTSLSDANQDVTVQWDSKTALQVKFKVFRDYWDDFCYPG